MLNVVFNASALLWPLTGIGQYAYHLVRGLKGQPELDLDFFYGNRFGGEIHETPSAAASRTRVWVRRFVPRAYDIRLALEQRHFSAGVARKTYDVYHEPNYLALRFGGPTVLTVHDLSWIRYPRAHPPERVRALNRRFEPALRRAALLLTDSAFVKDEVVDVFGVAPELVLPVPLGLDPVFRPMTLQETQPVLAAHGLVHGQYFLSVGTLEPRKNIGATLQAYTSLPETVRSRHPLVMVGMNGWQTSNLVRLMEPLVRSGQVRVLGYLQRGQLAAVTAGALALVYPSVYEGFGLPPLEAMGCGVVPITSNVSSLPEVVGDAGLLVHPQDTDALTDAMRLLVEDPALRGALSAKATARAAQFTWARCAAQTAAAYRLAARTSR